MSLDANPALRALRDEIRQFFAEELSPDIRRRVFNGEKIPKAEQIDWQRRLARKGWLAPAWPAEVGGPGWGPAERFLFDEEANLAGMPKATMNIPGLDLLGPVIAEFGTEEQKDRFLPAMLRAEHWWCQGFSEPGAGSDLASLTTRAIRDGDDYIVNGTKLWTSHAQDANWIFALVRTSIEPRKQAGISFLLIDMEQPGVTVSPIITLGGVHSVNQVTFENVRVPVANRIGQEGDAWKITKFLLGHERLIGAGIGPSSKLLHQLKAKLHEPAADNRPGAADQHLSLRLASLETELIALKYTAYRVLADELAGKAPGAEVSVLKIRGAEIQQALAELLMDTGEVSALVDPKSLPKDGPPVVREDEAYTAQQSLDRRKLTIYGGSSEIQRNIVAQRILHI